LQSPKLTRDVVDFSKVIKVIGCNVNHTILFQARYERRSGNLALQFGADDDAVLAMDPETRDRMFPLIQPAKDNALHRNSPSAVAEHCRDLAAFRSELRIRPSNRSDAKKDLVGQPLRQRTKKRNPRRNQGRRAMALCRAKIFPDRAAV